MKGMVEVFDEVYGRWYEKCVESVREGNLTLYGYSRILEEVQKRLADVLVLMEKLMKLEKEAEKVSQVDEAVRVLAYSIMELDEEDRREIVELVKMKLEKKKSEEKVRNE